MQQVDTPRKLRYDNPDNLFVAGFIGSPSINHSHVRFAGDRIRVDPVSLSKKWSLSVSTNSLASSVEASTKTR